MTSPLQRTSTKAPPRKGSSTTTPAAAKNASQGRVRIIAGNWRRTVLPVANKPGLRPTPDRVRETLFNWLGQDFSGLYCLDAFAGSGALGFEAASRNAAQVVLVEQDRLVTTQLQANALRLAASNIQIQRGDGLQALRQTPLNASGWDVIFIDPPYAAQLEQPALQAARHSLRPDGLVYLESAQQWNTNILAEHGWLLQHYLKAGAVHAHVLQRLEPIEPPPL
ncbi:16S rRNA (guanine(966)-N(2))-methyltransferase RsmD [Lampropedia puyangensis]|uniref:16S rRNA (Guanine(966)-N(2))-methyltransferase RsmD n=1 Tax=Lampropedia puyangensis TaxID=1330072 RepID=A0A4V4GRG5_9BURK|nr:16S rRNA (guanine(966)-N(2))-methyltransferase RsmD [Lampropedia puyangensis]THU01046.1 16S rRNA (guanine(966)-N(2))-methyltransferase RsmD [Lampropedia puyangensis]